MRPRYLGLLIVISRNKGGAYIICELDGSVFDRPIAAFRVIPYFARKAIPIPNLEQFLDITTDRLRALEESTTSDPDAISDTDALNNGDIHSDISDDTDMSDIQDNE